ncbi:tetratricopeptide repeat-containing sensor histidine kinase [Chitinophaga sancti]|uniref:histidine kinase n=1 Tax=Chitinophaga sancti TaxID=1004 RepID=A0A1K1PKW6_9BACT|nr:tetratricopeptide repeat-containing sensor histidine kinase [Chitinophaga sancti]WQD59486.1 ATP-binding protein [Chitinophaga sancti]WQG88380.1 ATP-binding protein [Chitinophaga sancti]SFW48113.1 hypothetical protein SAMN05661012_02063 [Chitinophaga sancti]
MKTPLILIACLFACNQRQVSPPVVTKNAEYSKADSFLYRHQRDSAFYYFNKIVSGSKDSLLIASSYNNMAVIVADAGDYFGSQDYLLLSLRYLDERQESNFYCLSSDYNELGGTSLRLKNYDAALNYYDLAIKYAQDDVFKQIFLNNKAVVYKDQKNFSGAIAIYDTIIHKTGSDRKAYAMILSNRANVRWLKDSSYNAAQELSTALQIRTEVQDPWGQNASYAHLSDYYTSSHPDSALIYANKMYAKARELDSPDDEVQALQKLIRLSPPQHIKPYFARYQYLSDSIQTARNTAKNQYALIRYDAEKNKAENLRLQKDNANKRLQIIEQRVMIYSAIGAVVLIIFLYLKRRQQLALEAENRIRKDRLKTSQKIHDVVANGLYRMMTEIEYQSAIDKEALLDKIETMYEQSRNISYEQPAAVEDYQAEIAQLLMAFSTDKVKVIIVGNYKELWSQLNNTVKIEAKHILQELMINMKKHSQASNVVIKFEQQDNQINIQYTDDGVGLPADYKMGNGLTSTENRIKNINGKLIFATNTKKGLKIQITFPFV